MRPYSSTPSIATISAGGRGEDTTSEAPPMHGHRPARLRRRFLILATLPSATTRAGGRGEDTTSDRPWVHGHRPARLRRRFLIMASFTSATTRAGGRGEDTTSDAPSEARAPACAVAPVVLDSGNVPERDDQRRRSRRG